MKQFNKEKSKEIYSNGISYSQEAAKKAKPIKSYDEWPILTPTGDLIGFVKLEANDDLPNEIWIKDKKYKLTEKISKI